MSAQKKIERKRINVFSRNDIYRFIGVSLVIIGGFMPNNTEIDKYGITSATNVITVFGILIFLSPLVFRYFQNKKQG